MPVEPGASGAIAMTSIRPCPRPLAAALLVLVLGGSPAIAGSDAPVHPGRLTADQLQKLFPAWRSLRVQAVQARIAILQKYQQCLQGAANTQAMKTCQKQEQDASNAQRQLQRTAIRKMFERNGIQLPERPAPRGTET